METEVFEEQDLARLEGLGGGFGLGAHAGGDKLHRLAEELLELGGDGAKGELLDDLAVRTAEVGHQHQGGAAFEQELDRRQGRGDTLGIRDGAGLLVLGDVEVDTDEDTLAFDGAEFAEGRSRHGGESSRERRKPRGGKNKPPEASQTVITTLPRPTGSPKQDRRPGWAACRGGI